MQADEPFSSELTCPDIETLSAYFDKEETLNANVMEHIEKCSACKEVLDSFKAIETSLNNGLLDAYTPDVSKNILDGVKKKLQAEDLEARDFKPSEFTWFARAAGFLVISSLVFYLLYSNHMITLPFSTGSHSNGPGIAVNNNTGAVNNVTFVNASQNDKVFAPYTAPANEASNNVSSGGSVDLRNVTFANLSFVGMPGSYTMRNNSFLQPQQRVVFIPSNVQHVWNVNAKDLSELQQKIANILKSQNIPDSMVQFNSEGGYLHLSVKLNSRQTVLLVRSLKNSGMNLLSSQPPQPEQSRFEGTGYEPVQYSANFVLSVSK